MGTFVLVALLAMVARSGQGQEPDRLLVRWVGTHQNQPLHLDFYADTMLVVNDRTPLSFHVSGGSLVAWGDTTFTVTYWFALDRLLILTEEGAIITMSVQDKLARPIWGQWRGSPIGSDESMELILFRGGVARWRPLPDGNWIEGEWNRRARMIAFMWQADSTVWNGRYDPSGAILSLDSTYAGTGMVLLRKAYRW